MKLSYKLVLVLACTLLFIMPDSNAQKKEKARNKFEYEKLHNGNRKLSARIFVKTNSGLVGVPGAEVSFAAETDSSKVKLGKVTTDEDGWAYLIIEKGYSLPQIEGKTSFGLTYPGNDSIKRLTDDMDIIDVDLAIKLDEDGDEKIATLVVTDFEGQPVDRTKVKLFVKRLYSLLPIGDERTDSTGMVAFSVPEDIPGDTKGNITLVGVIERDRKFGNVETRQDVSWGIPNSYTVSEEMRNLWTQSAPTWMQVMVFGVFIVVAVFFFYALYQVVMIPKDR